MEAMDLFSGIHNTPPSQGNAAPPHLQSNGSDTAPEMAPARESVPDADLLLKIDRIYREKARLGLLPKIAPKYLNRSGIAWLPIMHLERHGWHFKAGFSNTLRANRLGKTGDWVILTFRSPNGVTGRVTVITERDGSNNERRVLRGYDPGKNTAKN